MEQKLTAQIAAMYFGCKVKGYPFCGRPKAFETGSLVGLSEDHLHIKPSDSHSYVAVEIQNCQLILTPLSEISDEDAIEVFDMVSKWGDYHELDVCDIGKWLQEVFSSTRMPRADYVSGRDMVSLINTLRKLGYDCDNLIQSGIAIKS